MRVLVTRPAASGERTAKKLEARGHEALLLPLTAPVHDPTAASAALDNSTGAIAVTSAEALRALQAIGPALSAHLGRPLFAVGRATADKAVAAGFNTVHHSQGDGVELADLVASQKFLLGDRPLTYLAGFPRASGFEKRLSLHGVPFDCIECYRMEQVEPPETLLQSLFSDIPVDAVLFYSSHTARRFFGLALVSRHLEQLKKTRLLCMSATIATIVPYPLRSAVEIAEIPEEDSMLGLLDPDPSAKLI
ncbi:uroporphyrinogen-III synthase [Rhizobium tumorigenes]|uniref:Uroporphyrinogen-III synthase n=1 Tax=Rhizobium tumorigenes TaxID=2041385 RepID=A0AAF1K9A9_9HYPH|nr:uroporphyrinogen-III synthase [Rhizobium tumorigenes]WFR94982.1 uroporphyrinogen-III synthase [Rhizobium tumorigenes]